MRKLFVTGIGTDVGKTIVSAILVEALQADYWKPVQAGFENGTDTSFVKQLVSNSTSQFHKETYLLREPISPHAAAELENIKIELSKFEEPYSTNTKLVIEGAGGLLVPLNESNCVADLIDLLDCEVVLVSRNYLGSINHTLLTIEELKKRNCKIAGIIFNGARNAATESIILKKHSFNFVGYIAEEAEISKEIISSYSKTFNSI